MNTPTPDTANRLAIGISRSRNLPYDQAEAFLKSLTLCVRVMPGALQSPAEQAALLTAINSGKRVFLGGVQLEMPSEAPMLMLPLPKAANWAEAFKAIGFASEPIPAPSHTIYIGTPPPEASHSVGTLVLCDSWRGGAADVGSRPAFQLGDGDRLALGGILAGAAAVHRAFVRTTGLPSSLPTSQGWSLWNSRDDWTAPIAERQIRNLPRRLWVLGLGHLGQAFLWALSFLPYPDRSQVEFLLQDYDTIDESNEGSGLFCSIGDVDKKKARHSAAWLEALGFKTTITERAFGQHDRRGETEPAIALCGFDKARPRSFLEDAGFGLIIECGLGGSLANFDQGEIHVFPSERHSAHTLWDGLEDRPRSVEPEVAKLFGGDNQECGALAIDVAGKSVSTSFVGAAASALVIAELLKTFNRKPRHDYLAFDLRNPGSWISSLHTGSLRASQMGAWGYVETR